MSDLCRCPDHCGLPVIGARWYAWKCPWLAAQMVIRKAHKAAYNKRYRQTHVRKKDGPRLNKQKHARYDRWLHEDDPPEVIERKIDEELAKIRRARQTGQAA